MSTNHAVAAEPAPAAGIAPLAPGRRNYAMGLLLALGIVNYLDRQVIYILGEAIKTDLHLKDWQLGMLSGLAFGLLYTVLGLPIARLAERGDRPKIIGAAVAVWSGFTMLCGLAQNFWQLALARVGVGVGEAGCTPPAHSLIMDYAPPEKRSSALAFYGLGSPLGSLLGAAFGGVVASTYGWRTAFLLAGAPGLALAVMTLLTLPEPRRLLRAQQAKVAAASGQLRDMLRLVRAKRSYWFLAAAMTTSICVTYGWGPFIASFYLRNHPDQLADLTRSMNAALGMDLRPIGFLGLALGLTAGISGALGTWGGGQLADRLGPADPRRYCRLPAIALLFCAPAIVGALTVPWLALSFAFVGLQALLAASWYGPAFTAWFSLVPPNMRATNSALVLFVSNLIGLGLAPVAVGLASDRFALTMGPAEGVRWALMALGSISAIAALLFWLAGQTFRQDATD